MPVCHRMSGHLFIPKEKSNLLTRNAAETQPPQQMMECLGSRCAAWITSTDDQGHPKKFGACADVVQAVALSQLVGVIAEAASEPDEEEKTNG